MIFEVRTYRTRPGARTRFLHIFEGVSVPEHRRLGMTILGPLLAADPDAFVFLRSFPDATSRTGMIDSFYEGRVWEEQLEGELSPLLEQHEIILVGDPKGQIRW